MKGLILLNVLVSIIISSNAEEVRLLDLDPPEAQQKIESHDQSLHYAPKIESNVPAVRYLGNEPHNVLEDIYSARQYHGQDGLGGYLYGYNIPDIAKTEKKVAGGDLTGAYNYVADTGDEIKVQYWDNGTGFHQVDNVGDLLKSKQVKDTPEVQAEKDKFLARWHEEAERNQRPVSSPYNAEGQYASGPLSLQGQITGQSQYQHQPSSSSSVYQQKGQYVQNQQPSQAGSGQYHQSSQSGYQQSGGYTSYQQPGGYEGSPSNQQSGYQQYQQSAQSYQPSQSHHSITTQQPSQSEGSLSSLQQYQQPAESYEIVKSHSYTLSEYPGQYEGSASVQQSNHQQYQEPAQSYQGSPSHQYIPTQQPDQYSQTSGHYQGNPNQVDYTGAYSENQNSYSNPAQVKQIGAGDYNQGHYQGGQSQSPGYANHDQTGSSGQYDKTWEEEGVTGPPKGFFYEFDYPVGKIVQKGEIARVGDLHNMYSENKAKYEAQLNTVHPHVV